LHGGGESLPAREALPETEKGENQMLKKILLAGATALTLAACTAHEQRVATGAGLGAGAGAITGALITGDS
jgi:hypothetical protein